MTREPVRNLSASVLARLLERARRTGDENTRLWFGTTTLKELAASLGAVEGTA